MAHIGTRGRCLLGLVVFAAALTAGLHAQDADPNTVRARLHAYLSAYEPQLSTLVAEEHLTQWPERSRKLMDGGTFSFQRDEMRRKALSSDVAFVSLPGNAGWLGYRDVRAVNTKAVGRSGPPLASLLNASSDDGRERAMALLLEGARHNLGAPRTINLPSLPLELLHLRNQARFVITGSGRERSGDCHAVRLDLEETVRPTLIQRPDGGNMPSRVSAWVDPESGRLCRAEVRTRDAQLGAWFEAVVGVEFRMDAAVGVMVPSRMWEIFFDPPRGRGEGEATYVNYRRIGTTSPQGSFSSPGPR